MITAPIARRIMEKGFAGELKEAEPLHRHVSLRVGGLAALFAVPGGVEDIVILLGCLKEEGVPWVLLGGGTNMVFANGGYGGCVVQLGSEFARIEREGDSMLLADAAASLSAVVTSSADSGLSGIECLTGIPGTVGGAVFMNAGTRSGEIADVIHEVRLFNGKDARWVPGGELDFSYRSSAIPHGEIILSVRLQLAASSRREVRLRMKAEAERRKGTQPTGVPSSGCWFRNPEGNSAGRLIEEAGMKGERCGDAQVSQVHANFFVNAGGATASDFLALAEKVKSEVHRQFGVMLQEEVRIIDG
jgi:UDP-N-acetylmuramate dehydrogenase